MATTSAGGDTLLCISCFSYQSTLYMSVNLLPHATALSEMYAPYSLPTLLLLLLFQVPVCHAAGSQLSQAELEELLAENAKLKQLLNTYADRLSPEQVCRGWPALMHYV